MTTNDPGSSPMSVQNPRTEYLENPLGIDVRPRSGPRLSWQVAACCPGSTTAGRGMMQLAYQVQAARDPGALAAGDLVWDSGRVASGDISARYGGPQPVSRQRIYWRVRAWDQDRRVTEWSEPAWWETGLLEESEWTADWLEVGWDEDPKAFKPCPYFRRAFSVDGPVSVGAALHHEPRPLRSLAERRTGRRPALHTRVHYLRQAPAVPGLRRHRNDPRRRQRAGRHARRRLVPRQGLCAECA